MKRISLIGLVIITFILTSFKLGVDVTNYYGVPNVINYDKTDYKLIASYHPTEQYYKQEYIPDGQSPDHYKTLLLIDFYLTQAPDKDMIERKEAELDARKKIDAATSYKQYDNSDSKEYLLEFFISDNVDKKLIIERNLYRYKNYTDKAGHTGILLFGLSQRGYNGVSDFLTTLKQTKGNDINNITSYEIPEIQLK